jgi:hypothetical protein
MQYASRERAIGGFRRNNVTKRISCRSQDFRNFARGAERCPLWENKSAQLPPLSYSPACFSAQPQLPNRRLDEYFWRSLAMDDWVDGERPPVVETSRFRYAGMVARYDRVISRSLLDGVRSAAVREYFVYERAGFLALLDPELGAAETAHLPERNDLPFFQRPRISAKGMFLRETGYPQRVRWPMTWELYSFWAPEPEAQDAFHYCW